MVRPWTKEAVARQMTSRDNELFWTEKFVFVRASSMGRAQQLAHYPPRRADRRWRCLELDDQLIRLHLDADDVATDEVTVIVVRAIREMRADGASDASLDLRCRHPTNGSGTPRLPMQER
jgi:hypothetical protein